MIGIIINNIRECLKASLNPNTTEIVVKVTDEDKLRIIITSNIGTWNYAIDNISDHLVNGITASNISSICLKAYRNTILSYFFK